jgi:hypothetical protein
MDVEAVKLSLDYIRSVNKRVAVTEVQNFKGGVQTLLAVEFGIVLTEF